MKHTYYNPTTEEIHTGGILGLSPSNCGDHGLVVVTTAPRPTLVPNEQASLNPAPDSSGVRQWTVTTVPVTESDIRAEGGRRLRMIASTYTDEERETWANQVDEANALAADPEADVPMISALAAADGVTVAQMAWFIVANKTAFTAASAAILAGQRTLIAMDPIPDDYTNNSYWT